MNRNSHIRSSFLLLAALWIVTACTEKGIYDVERTILTLQPHVLKVSPSSFVFDGNNGGKAQFSIESQNTGWEIVGLPDWLKADGTSSGNESTGTGTVTFTATPNISAIARTTVIQVKSTEDDWVYNVPITLTQSRAIFHITPSTSSVTFNGGASSQTVGITTLTNEWTVTPLADLTDWCKVTRTDNSHIQISVQPNTHSVSRTGHIELATDTRNATITVTQRPAGIKGVIANVNFGQAGGSQQLGTISVEAPWTAQTSEAWLSLTPATAEAGDTKIAIHARANNSMKSRTGYVYIVVSDETKQEIKVVQEGISFEVEPTSLSFPAAGSDEERAAEFTVTTNAPWEVSGTLPDWIILNREKGDATAKVKLIVRSNPSSNSRSATLTLRPTAVNSPRYISVSQKGINVDVSGATLNFSSEGGSQQMNLSCNGMWSALASPTAWFSVTPSSGTGSAKLTVKAEPYNGRSTRQGNLLVSCGDVNASYRITQDGTWIDLSESAFQFSSQRSAGTFMLQTNKKWEAKRSVSWITLSATSGEGDCQLTVTAADNPSANPRSGTFTITTSDGKTVNATVKQAGRYLTVETETVTFINAGGSQGVSVSTDGTFNVTSTASWLSFTKYAKSFIIKAAANTAHEDREATVTVSLTDLKEGKLEHTIKVKQTQADFLEVSTESLSFATTGGTNTVKVNTNLSWTTSRNQTWITLSSTSGTGSGDITITAADNPSANERSGYVIFRAGSFSKRVNITQAARTLTVGAESLSFSSKAGQRTVTVKSESGYEATSNADWITITKRSSYIIIYVAENTFNLARAGNVTISVPGLTEGTLSHTIEVQQEAAATQLSADVETLTFLNLPNYQYVTITANGTWTAKTAPISYFTVSPTSGTGSATLTVSAKENTTSLNRNGTLTLSCGGETIQIKLVQKAKPTIQFVDLGLPSGIQWATCNIGASSPEEAGDLFAWGETMPKDRFEWDNYKFGTPGNLTKYNFDSSQGVVDNKWTLDLIDDAAYVIWGVGCRIPSPDEMAELGLYCSFTWTTLNGVEGYEITSNINGKSIFLPSTFIWDENGPGASYWTSVLWGDGAIYGTGLNFWRDYVDYYWAYWNRCGERSIRPVYYLNANTLTSIAPMTDEAVWSARVNYNTQWDDNWVSPDFDDSSWPSQNAAWGTRNTGENYPRIKNDWSAEYSDIYIRRTVTLTANDLKHKLVLKARNDDDIHFYVNGTLVAEWGYSNYVKSWLLNEDQRALFHVGENLIAVRCHNNAGPGYVDFGLYRWE